MLTVSNYHYIREDFAAPFPSIFGVTPKQFRSQLHSLERFMEFVNPIDFANDPEKFIKSKKNYGLVTFDDGLKEQMEFAVPILKEIGIPAIFFVNTINFIEEKVSAIHKNHLVRSKISATELWSALEDQYGKNCITQNEKKFATNHYNFDNELTAWLKYFMSYRLSLEDLNGFIDTAFFNHFEEKKVLSQLYMTKSHLIDLAKSGFLGSHTHSHFPLGRLSVENIKNELTKSKIYLEELTTCKIDFVSYPYGDSDSTKYPVAQIAAETGHKFGFTTNRAINTSESNLLLLSRFDCNDLPEGKNSNHYNYLWKQG